MVVFDATFIMLFLDPKVISNAERNLRVDYLVESLSRAGDRIVLPTPALSELLVGAAEAGPQYLEIINRSAHFRIESFGTKAAVEAAAATRDAMLAGGKRGTSVAASWAKVKYDRQIVAIAKVVGARAIYSDDDDIRKLGAACNLTVIGLAELPEPPVKPQIEMALPAPAAAELTSGEKL